MRGGRTSRWVCEWIQSAGLLLTCFARVRMHIQVLKPGAGTGRHSCITNPKPSVVHTVSTPCLALNPLHRRF